jgi:hypothetical protein
LWDISDYYRERCFFWVGLVSGIFPVDGRDCSVGTVDGCLKRLLKVVAQSRWDDEKGGFVVVDYECGDVPYSHGGNKEIVEGFLGCVVGWNVPDCVFCIRITLS